MTFSAQRFRIAFQVACLLVLAVAGRCGFASEVVLVCPDDFRETARAWIADRENQGLSIATIPSQRTAGDLLRSVRDTADTSTRYVVLMGDCPSIGRSCDPRTQIPTHYQSTSVTRNWGSTPTLATDFPYGDLSGDGTPSAAVGRLPVSTRDELAAMIRRIRQREASRDFGDWRRRIDLTAGVGGFGLLADMAIESVAKAIITGVLPTDTMTAVAYASPGHPFYPDSDRTSFRRVVLDRYQRGSRFWVYAGHGWIDQLDRVPATRDGLPVLDAASVTRLKRSASSSPVALMLACYTGAFDAPQSCLAERMIRHSGGPIAVIAGSRVTMPYGNTTACVGLIHGIYHHRKQRLGDAWLHALTAMHATGDAQAQTTSRKLIDALATLISPGGTELADERGEHMRLYNLLGDPTMRLHPPAEAEIEVTSGHLDGKTVALRIASPIAGSMRVSIDLPLGGEVPAGVAFKQACEGHATVAQHRTRVDAGQPTSVQFDLPPTIKGSVICRVMVEGETTWAAGSAKIALHPKPDAQAKAKPKATVLR